MVHVVIQNRMILRHFTKHGTKLVNVQNQGSSGLKISDVHFSNIHGTTMMQIAVTLNCSQSNPCQKIDMRDINIAYNGGGGPAKSTCAIAHGTAYGQENPPPCLIA
ncbi:hypothetical protein Q3G72_007823 [Acer saccharum]|nr:hypothetical protein Q3G72_007823 [Acer saccharum]